MGNKGFFFFFGFLPRNARLLPNKRQSTTLKFPRVQFQASILFGGGSVSGYGFHKLISHLATRNILSRYVFW